MGYPWTSVEVIEAVNEALADGLGLLPCNGALPVADAGGPGKQGAARILLRAAVAAC